MDFFKGKLLKEGHATRQHQQFEREYGTRNFPLAVCYSLQELRDFIKHADDMFDKMTNPPLPQNRGVALTLGVHLKEDPKDPPNHAEGKLTIMMVASVWTDAGAGRASACDNRVLRDRTPGPLNDGFSDISYDAGSLYP